MTPSTTNPGDPAITTLILVPTQLERQHVGPVLADVVAKSAAVVELCGFGLVAAGARTSALIADHQPERVLLLGIAGSYGDRVDVATATLIDAVVCDGIGVGAGSDHVSAAQLGWSMIDSKEGVSGAASPIGGRIDLTDGDRVLVSCCAASANSVEADARQRAHPGAVAEDMEGFAVALSCKLAGVPLTIVRGISNVAGDRDHSKWQIESALRSAAELAIPMIEERTDV